jgi:hypothetical protein
VRAERRSDVEVTQHRHTAADTERDVDTANQDVRLVTATRDATIEAIVHDDDQVCGESSPSHSRAWWDRRPYHVAVDLAARVPEGTRVRLCTVNGESVVTSGDIGDFDVSNVNGRIELERVHGSGRAMTVNGGIRITFAESPRQASRFATVNGDIAVTFPRDLAADLRLKTFHGELLTDFEVQPLPAQPRTVREVRNGRFVYRTGGFTAVRVGRGGPELQLETLNGDVRVLRAER